MRIAEEKFLIKDKEILINSHNIFYKCLRQHNKETIRYMIFRKCILKTVTKHLLTRNKIIKNVHSVPHMNKIKAKNGPSSEEKKIVHIYGKFNRYKKKQI